MATRTGAGSLIVKERPQITGANPRGKENYIMNISFSVSESEYESLRAVVLVAYENLRNDLDNDELSEIAASVLSREFSNLANLKRILNDE